MTPIPLHLPLRTDEAAEPIAVIESRARATAGRLNYSVADPNDAGIVAEGLLG
jgi:hypothetical protein